MGRVLAGLAISIASAWMVLVPASQPGQVLAWSPFLAPPLALLAFQRTRTLQAVLLVLALLLLLADAVATGWHGHSGEAQLLCYVLHVWFAAACMLAVLLGAAWRLMQRHFDARFARRPK